MPESNILQRDSMKTQVPEETLYINHNKSELEITQIAAKLFRLRFACKEYLNHLNQSKLHCGKASYDYFRGK